MSLIKFHHDIVKPEKSENYHGHLSLLQNTRTKQFKIRHNVKTNFGVQSIVFQCVKNAISYHSGFSRQKKRTFSRNG